MKGKRFSRVDYELVVNAHKTPTDTIASTGELEKYFRGGTGVGGKPRGCLKRTSSSTAADRTLV